MVKLTPGYVSAVKAVFESVDTVSGRDVAILTILRLDREQKRVRSDLNTDERRILSVVAEKHNVNVEDMRGESKFHRCVVSRREGMYEIERQLRYSHGEIASVFNRDRSTVSSAISKHRKEINQDRQEGGKSG